MTVKFDKVTVCQLREKQYDNGKVYFASIIDNGFMNSVTCSEEFYKKNIASVRQSPLTLNGQLAELRWFKGVVKVKLI